MALPPSLVLRRPKEGEGGWRDRERRGGGGKLRWEGGVVICRFISVSELLFVMCVDHCWGFRGDG